jgi:Xaa-Pro aminopeptidase
LIPGEITCVIAAVITADGDTVIVTPALEELTVRETLRIPAEVRPWNDDTVRAFYASEGQGPGYRLPGLAHRTGHGIGLDGHESPYLVHGNQTPPARSIDHPF